MHDQITRFSTGRILDGAREVTKANTGDGFTHGIELGATRYFAHGFSLFGNITWAEGELDIFVGNVRSRQPASRIQPITAQIGPHWWSSDGRFRVESSARFAGRQDRLLPGGTPGYSIYSVRARWRVRPQIVLTAAVENLSNEDSRTHGSGFNEPGINVVTTLRLTF